MDFERPAFLRKQPPKKEWPKKQTGPMAPFRVALEIALRGSLLDIWVHRLLGDLAGASPSPNCWWESALSVEVRRWPDTTAIPRRSVETQGPF